MESEVVLINVKSSRIHTVQFIHKMWTVHFLCVVCWWLHYVRQSLLLTLLGIEVRWTGVGL